ncbi:MAG: IS21 family transposase, partial [Oculatellaceae cyanobacterium Prado106]|nr:IS21 family transposase [Oculatellaceae cyanobacterium Prado106]
MRGKPIKVEQIQVYMRARKQDLTQAQSAEIAGISERSGRRVETQTHQPQRKPRGRKPDPLSAVWHCDLLPRLEADPLLEPMTLYEHLLEQYPGEYEGVLRTL